MHGSNNTITDYLQIKKEIVSNRADFEKEKAAWLSVRNDKLDEHFKSTFERLEGIYTGTAPLKDILTSLQALVHKGASARLLGDYELGTYNLAMLVKDIGIIKDKASLDIITEIIRLTIIAEANLNTQKAYAGNGGATAMEWLCMYLAGGSDKLPPDQYQCCYKVFCWIIERVENPFPEFLAIVREAPEIAEMQEKMIRRMICLNLSPYPSFRINIKLFDLVFPYEEDHFKHYIKNLKENLTDDIIKQLLNAFTSQHQSRKDFREFFSRRPHWLLKRIIEQTPDVLFNLAKRNEKELLIPFLKHFKSALIDLRNKNGNTLLQEAMQSRGLSQNTVQLLLNAGLK